MILVQAISMQPDERRIIILDEIPGQDESDTSTSTKGRRTNRSSVSQLPKGSAGSTRQRASARPATSLTCPSEPRDLGQGGYESARTAQSTPYRRTAGAPMRTAAGSCIVFLEQSSWSHYLLRGHHRVRGTSGTTSCRCGEVIIRTSFDDTDLRSFYRHKSASDAAARTTSTEGGPLLSYANSCTATSSTQVTVGHRQLK
jgi:hypothetical protein